MKTLARITGVCVFVVVAIPGIAGGIYEIACQDYLENLPAYLGLTDSRILGFAGGWGGYTFVGSVHLLLGVAGLITGTVLTFWPGKVADRITTVWNSIARRTSACNGRGQSD